MNKVSIKDNNNDDYVIKDLKSFYQHILDYHASGTSLHEENGHYFTVNDDALDEGLKALIYIALDY